MLPKCQPNSPLASNTYFNAVQPEAFIFHSTPLQILKPSEKKAKYQYQGMSSGGRPVTPRGPTGAPVVKRK